MSVIHGHKPAANKPGCSDAHRLAFGACVARLSVVCGRNEVIILGLTCIDAGTTRFMVRGNGVQPIL